jgi:geranylgeranyl diphosphate synthase type I
MARAVQDAVTHHDHRPPQRTHDDEYLLSPARTDSPHGPALLDRYAAMVAGPLAATAPPPTSMTGLMASYHMGWVDRHGQPAADRPAGKLVRPCLCLWACEAVGGDPAQALPLACAVEWLHNFTLVHDDIQDGDHERRHRPTVWSIWGAHQGINAGDAMHALAFETLLASGPQAARQARVLAGAVRRVVEGQCLDLQQEGTLSATPAAYLRMAAAKTGALIGACLEAGAIAGGARGAVAARLRRAGELLGLAFQVRDDWLGTWGDPELTGKSRDGDLRRRKVTYPVVVAYAHMNRLERARFRTLFLTGGASAVQELRRSLEACGAAQVANGAAARFAREAVALAGGLARPSVAWFAEFATHVAERSR